MFEKIFEKLFDKANFNRLMFALAIVLSVYLITNWPPVWSVLNIAIFIIDCYCVLIIVEWLCKKLKPSSSRSHQRKKNKQWEQDVISFFYSLPKHIQDKLLTAYTYMDKDRAYYNQRNTSDYKFISLCRDLETVDFSIPVNGYYGEYSENCVVVYEKNDVATIVFDPVIYKELSKLSAKSNAVNRK